MLTADVELVFDGGPNVKTAARHPIRGADRVARFLAFAMARLGHTATSSSPPSTVDQQRSYTPIESNSSEPSSSNPPTTTVQTSSDGYATPPNSTGFTDFGDERELRGR